eukprot:1195513-Prorocentrum_minimum.AAC.4
MQSYDNEQPSQFEGVNMHGYHHVEEQPDQTTLFDLDSCFPVGGDAMLEEDGTEVTTHLPLQSQTFSIRAANRRFAFVLEPREPAAKTRNLFRVRSPATNGARAEITRNVR